MDFPIIIVWVSPFSVSGAYGVIFKFSYNFFMKILLANRIAPDEMPHFAASHLGLYCLPMSNKKDVRLIRLKHTTYTNQQQKAVTDAAGQFHSHHDLDLIYFAQVHI